MRMFFFSKFYWQMIRMKSGHIVAFGGLFILVCSFLAYILEPDTFGNPFNGFWWVMTTVTTVGYGDFYPHTVPGKCLGVVLYVFGIGLISIAISKVVDKLFIYQRKKEEGKLRYTGRGHFVIVDWNRQAEHTIEEIFSTDPAAEVVLIAQLPKTPASHPQVHYIKGNPVREETLDMANLGEARAVFIFADDTMGQGPGAQIITDPAFVDGKTLLVATAIERNYAHVYSIAEIRDRHNLGSFKHVKIDDFVFGNETISHMAVRSAFNPGTTAIFQQLLTRNDGEDLYEVCKKAHWHTFRHAFEDLLNQGATLISDGAHLNINQRLNEPIPENSRLFVICTAEIYEKVKDC
jgi:voltage-gated potassium channel